MARESCESVRPHLLDLLEGAVDRERDRWLRSHLAECRACARELEALEDTWSRLPEAGDVSPPAAVKDGVLAYARSGAGGRQAAPLPTSRRTRARWVAAAAAVAAVAATGWLAVVRNPDLRPVAPGTRAPDFLATNVRTGDTVSLADYRGDVVLLNVWATWCKPCETEMPSIERLYRRLGPEGLRVVAVSVDIGASDRVRDWARDRDLSFEILHDFGGIERRYQTTGVPETFVIDRHGEIVKRYIGAAEWDHPTQTAIIRRLLEPD